MTANEYRAAERRFWAAYGLEPTEQTVRLEGTGTAVRVQEIGDGEPMLFIHGGPNAGSGWIPLVAQLGDFRCLLVDRPGTGLSEPYPLTAETLPHLGTRFVSDVLDGLGVNRAHLVASSFGGHLAMRAALTEPARVGQMVQFGAAPALGRPLTYPLFMRLMMRGWVRRILNRLPPNERAGRMTLRQIGHGASLTAGRIPRGLLDWYLALQSYTDTFVHEGELVGALVPHESALLLDAEALSSLQTPTLFLWGEDDAFGGAEHARAVAGMTPNAELVMMPACGHLPWLGDPEFCAGQIRSFLTASPRVFHKEGELR